MIRGRLSERRHKECGKKVEDHPDGDRDGKGGEDSLEDGEQRERRHEAREHCDEVRIRTQQ